MIDGDNICVICLENIADLLLLPCSHNCVCSTCSQNLAFLVKCECPICRKKFLEMKIKSE